MIIHNLVGTEDNPVYRTFEAQNLIRQYDLTRSLFIAGSQLGYPGLDQTKLKAMNYHGIACLHDHAGEWRPHNVKITNTEHVPPPFEQVPDLMDDFIKEVNGIWGKEDAAEVAALVLWRLNWIHPFVNGNGRTARVAAYYTLCRAFAVWLPGTVTVPELIRADRLPYYAALRIADTSAKDGKPNLAPLAEYLGELLLQQLASAQTP